VRRARQLSQAVAAAIVRAGSHHVQPTPGCRRYRLGRGHPYPPLRIPTDSAIPSERRAPADPHDGFGESGPSRPPLFLSDDAAPCGRAAARSPAEIAPVPASRPEAMSPAQ